MTSECPIVILTLPPSTQRTTFVPYTRPHRIAQDMKYGDTLRQRSIPEWGHFNIDYDYLKDLIKHQTTSGTVKATSIPGQGAASERAFGDTFLRALEAQHDRITRFIRSKSGEIERRLEHIGKSAEQLQARQSIHGLARPLPARMVERYAKMDADVTKVGEEIRSLSRFQTTQQMGFRKILKKYKRWTRDAELELCFRDSVTSRPDSFYQLDLGYLLGQYIGVLGVLRALFDASGDPTSSAHKQVSTSASEITRAVDRGTEVDFDLALSMTPLDPGGSGATYWIHQDHIVEVEVLLLQHMRLRPAPDASKTHDSRKTTPGRRSSATNVDRCGPSPDATGLLVLDHPETFAIKQNASTIGSKEEAIERWTTRAAGSAWWSSSSGDAAVAVGPEGAIHEAPVARLKRKHLAAFLDVSKPLPGASDQDTTEATQSSDATAATTVRRWLAEQGDVKPVAGVCSKRTRFVGLHNTQAGGVWATLDTDIFMKTSLETFLGSENWLDEAQPGSTRFPHAVLQVRGEGRHSSTLVQTLDQSHLLERVRGFSLEAHAVWACCRPSTTSPPFWIQLLDKDIRKLPPPTRRQRRKASADRSHSHNLHAQTSASTPSLTEGQASPYTSRNEESSATSAPEMVDMPALQAFRKKRKSYKDSAALTQVEPEGRRYWNEYDNPEYEDEGYYIYLDPNETVDFPGRRFFEACAAMTRRLFRVGEIPQDTTTTTNSSDDESNDDSPVTAPKGYGTFAFNSRDASSQGYFSGLLRSFRDPTDEVEAWRASRRERRTLLSELELRRHSDELTKFRFYSTCLAMATVLSIILGMMTVTSRKKEKGAVGYAILFGTICNFLLCITGLLIMKSRRERLGWLHQGLVALVAGLNVAVGVLLIRWTVVQL